VTTAKVPSDNYVAMWRRMAMVARGMERSNFQRRLDQTPCTRCTSRGWTITRSGEFPYNSLRDTGVSSTTFTGLHEPTHPHACYVEIVRTTNITHSSGVVDGPVIQLHWRQWLKGKSPQTQ